MNEHTENPAASSSSTAPPVVEQVYIENGDNIHVEIPRGEVRLFFGALRRDLNTWYRRMLLTVWWRPSEGSSK